MPHLTTVPGRLFTTHDKLAEKNDAAGAASESLARSWAVGAFAGGISGMVDFRGQWRIGMTRKFHTPAILQDDAKSVAIVP
jgi:hypothetical protein